MIIRKITYRVYALLMCLSVVLLAACSEWEEQKVSDGVGKLTFADISVTAEVSDGTRAISSSFSLPEFSTDDVIVYVVDMYGDTVASGKVSDLADGIELIASTYTVKAAYGSNSLAISDAPYYSGSSSVTVNKDATTATTLNLSLQSAMVKPVIPSSSHLSAMSCKVTSGDEEKTLSDGDVAYISPSHQYTVSMEGTNKYGYTLTQNVYSNMTPTAAKLYNISLSLKLSLPDQSAGAWAKRFYVTPITTMIDGASAELPDVEYQFSTDKQSWTTLTKSDGYYCHTGLTPNTKYYVRAKLDDLTSDVKEITTESEVQLPNSDMETWNSTEESYYTVWYPRDNKDESGTEGWCTMNTKTSSEGASYAYNRNSGTEQTTTCNSGTYAAEIKTIGWGSGCTCAGSLSIIDNISAGELFLGTMDSSYTPNYYFHFSNRPSKLTFYVQYTPKSSRMYTATLGLYDENKELILSEEYTLSEGSISSYTKKEISISYKYMTVKPTYIKLAFSSGDNSSSEMDKPSRSASAKNKRSIGNKLYIDDISLVYE